MAERADDVDVVVIGMGPGGEEVASRLAEAGLDVVGVERELVGGECPYWGCIPSKMIIRGANVVMEARRVHLLAGSASVHPSFAPVAERVRVEATDDWDDKAAVGRFEDKGGRLVRGSARLDGPARVRVDERSFTARRGVVVATGSAPVVPPIHGLDGTAYWTNREAIAAVDAPASLVVLGGGAVGLELAQAFARFGTAVTVVEGQERVLPLEEPEASAVVKAALEEDGISVRTGVHAVAVRQSRDETAVTLDDDSTAMGDKLLVSVGRRPNVRDLGLETVGFASDIRALEVDELMRAGDRLWAVGDVTGVGAFTHLAIYQADIAVRDILGEPGKAADYRGLSRVTFTDPEVGSVGLSEQEARAQGRSVRTGVSPLESSTRGWIHGPGGGGVLKLVEDADEGVLVGATSCGPWGGEVLSMLTLAVHARIPVTTLRTMIYAYPTFHRGVLDALENLRESQTS